MNTKYLEKLTKILRLKKTLLSLQKKKNLHPTYFNKLIYVFYTRTSRIQSKLLNLLNKLDPSERPIFYKKIMMLDIENNPSRSTSMLTFEDSPFRKIIEQDVNRTISPNISSDFLFVEKNTTRLQQSLTTVLLRLSVSVPELGYFQGLNFVAFFLLRIADEELTSKILTDLFIHGNKKYALESLFTREFELLDNITNCLEQVLRKSKLCDFFFANGKPVFELKTVFASSVLTLFTDLPSFQVQLVFFDRLVVEGRVALVKTCLALVKLNKKKLLSVIEEETESSLEQRTVYFYSTLKTTPLSSDQEVRRFCKIYSRVKVSKKLLALTIYK